MIRADEHLVLVAEADGEIVGNALVSVDRGVATAHIGVLSITVADGWRDVGSAPRSWRPPQDWVRDRGLTRLALSVFPDNARAIAVYTRAGFVREGCAGASSARRMALPRRGADGVVPRGGATDRWDAGGDATRDRAPQARAPRPGLVRAEVARAMGGRRALPRPRRRRRARSTC